MSDRSRSIAEGSYTSGQTIAIALLAGLVAKSALELQRSPLERWYARRLLDQLRQVTADLTAAVEGPR